MIIARKSIILTIAATACSIIFADATVANNVVIVDDDNSRNGSKKNTNNSKGIRGGGSAVPAAADDEDVSSKRRSLQVPPAAVLTPPVPPAVLTPPLPLSPPPPLVDSSPPPVDLLLDGRLSCVPVTGEIGEVSCTFNTKLPVDTDTTKCMDSEEVGGQICLTFNPTKLPINTDNLPPPSTANFPIGTHNGKSMYDMKCPRNVPQTGSSCGAWIPNGATAGKCQYAVDGPTCECVRSSDGGRSCWNCGDENFTGCIIEIDAPLSSLTKPPIDVPTRTEYVKLTDPTGRHDSCPPPMTPSILNTGMKCDDVTIRCLYLDTYNEGETATKYIDCRCGPDMKLSCADADPSHYVTKGGSGNILASF